MFKRFQKETHMLGERKISASYDRFSTLFTLSLDDKVLVSKRLIFRFKYKKDIEVESKTFSVHVFKFILWRSKLTEKNEVIINELIPSRKRKSLGALIYSSAVNVARLLS